MKKVTKIDIPDRPENRLRVAAYARVSTDSSEQLTSLEAQKTYYENLIRLNPEWEYAGLYYDEGITGTKTDKRDGLLRLLRDCRNGKIDYILVKSISRLARNTVDTLEIVRELTDRGIYMSFEKEKIDTRNMNGELLLSILSSLAQSESFSISANEKWAIQKRYEQGTFVIGYPPYGYKNENGQMVIIPEQAEIVRWIFDEFLSGNGTYRIANALNDKGLPSKKGGKWTSSGINGMLKNEKYTGDVLYQKTYTDDQFNRHANNGDEIQYYVKDHHEAIISHETFEAAQLVMEQNGKACGNVKGAAKYQKRYPFSGKIICGECGGTFKRRKHKTIEGGYFTYCCSTHITDKDSCSMLYICEDQLEAAFMTMLNKLITYRAFVLEAVISSLKATSYFSSQDRIEEINSLLEVNLGKRKNLLDLLSQGYLEASIYKKENTALEAEATSLTSERDSLTRSVDAGIGSLEQLEKLNRFCETEKPFTEFHGEIVERFMEKAIIKSREEVTFVLKCGLQFTERM